MATTSAEERAIEIERDLATLRGQQTGVPSRAENVLARSINEKKGQLRLAEIEARFGAPKRTGSEDEFREFTLPDTSRREFTEGGDLRRIRLSDDFSNRLDPTRQPGAIARRQLLHDIRRRGAMGQEFNSKYKDLYSPQDQRAIEKLQNARSSASTDPDLFENERQQFFDSIDARLSKIPKLSPMMREKSAQEKMDARKVTVNNQEGYVDNSGKFIPFVDPKFQQAQAENRQDAISKEYNAIMAAAEKKGEKIEPPVAFREAKNTVALLYGEIPEITDMVGPEMTTVWRDEVDDLSINAVFGEGKTRSKKNMRQARSDFITRMTRDFGYSAEQAGHSFMMLWDEAARNPKDEYNKYVPAFGEQEQAELTQVVTGRMQEDDPRLSKRRGTGTVTVDGKTLSTEDIKMMRGEGTVTVDGKTLNTLSTRNAPPGMETIWPNLDDEVKADVQRLLLQGKTVPEILAKLKELGLI